MLLIDKAYEYLVGMIFNPPHLTLTHAVTSRTELHVVGKFAERLEGLPKWV